MMDNKREDSIYLPVAGAGEMRISKTAGYMCGNISDGFSIAVGPPFGGVLSKEDAKKLADHIYEVLNNAE